MSDEIDKTPQESNTQEPSMTEEIKTVEGEAQTEATAETQKTMPPLTAERVTDITLGLGKAAVEVLDKAARQLDDSVRQIRTDAPGFLTEMEEKGRPLREKLSEGLRGFSITDVFTRTGEKTGEPDNTLDDIEALENRVRELEQQVSSDPLTDQPVQPAEAVEASPFSMLELDDDPIVVAAEQEQEVAPATVKKPPVRKKKKEEESPAAE